MSRELPPKPNLAFLKDQAKRLLDDFRQGQGEALSRFKSFHPRLSKIAESQMQGQNVSLSDAQLVLAREHGFKSWPRLKHFVETQAALHGSVPIEVLREEIAYAAKTGDTALMAEILDAHLELKDIEDPGDPGWTLLDLAAFHGQEDALKLLLQRGANVALGQPLHFAGQRGRQKICKLLAEAGAADVYSTSKDRAEIAAWRCALSFDAQGLRQVLNKRRELARVGGRYGRTMLHEAATNGDVAVIEALLEFGADADAKDQRGMTAFQRAEEHRQRGAVELLAQHGTACDICVAVQFGLFERVKQLAEKDSQQLQACDRRGFSLLRLARQHVQKEIAQFLLARGAPDDKENSAKRWLEGKEFLHQNLSGAMFRDLNLSGAAFEDINISNATFQNMNFSGTSFFNMNFTNAQIDEACIDGLKIYGVEVKPLVLAELEKRRKQN